MPFLSFCEQEKIAVKQNESMKNHTSFKIGGECDYFVMPESFNQLKSVIDKLNELEIPYFLLGKGSNLLVSDSGIKGAVISMMGLCDIEVNGDELTAGAGVSIANLCTTALSNSLSGMEFAYGIPGSVGGGLYMNCGAYGGQFSDTVVKAEYLTNDGEINTIEADDMCLGYRTSIFKQNNGIVLSATFKFKKDNAADIKARMDDYMERRITKQPLEYPSAGSVFKRPEGHFAGALIEQAGLKGYTIGGAQVSEKHSGFVINIGEATANDIKALMGYVQAVVYENYQVMLEPEVRIIGDWN